MHCAAAGTLIACRYAQLQKVHRLQNLLRTAEVTKLEEMLKAMKRADANKASPHTFRRAGDFVRMFSSCPCRIGDVMHVGSHLRLHGKSLEAVHVQEETNGLLKYHLQAAESQVGRPLWLGSVVLACSGSTMLCGAHIPMPTVSSEQFVSHSLRSSGAGCAAGVQVRKANLQAADKQANTLQERMDQLAKKVKQEEEKIKSFEQTYDKQVTQLKSKIAEAEKELKTLEEKA